MSEDMTGKEYICKIASLEEMNRKWDYEIGQHPESENWIVWKSEAIDSFRTGRSVPYYGILDGTIICEATAVLYPDFPQGSENPDKRAVELCAFRTVKAYRGMGFFSKLMDFMLKDLKQKGYTEAVVGVEPDEKRNKAIYHHWGFTEHVSTGTETYPDGTVIDVEFYGKQLRTEKEDGQSPAAGIKRRSSDESFYLRRRIRRTDRQSASEAEPGNLP